jgi:transposase-like protein
MRYPDGGGLSPQGRAKREQVRRQAAGWFGVSTDESGELKRIRRENAELRRANEILKSASLDPGK